MTGSPTLSIFTVDIDRKPIFAVQFKKHAEAEDLFADDALLNQLRMVRTAGIPLLDDYSILRVRLAREDERARYFANASSLLTSNGKLAVLLVDLDNPAI